MEINTAKLQKEMARQSLTYYGLARALGMRPYNIQYIIAKKSTRLSTIQKIADYFDIDAKDLLK